MSDRIEPGDVFVDEHGTLFEATRRGGDRYHVRYTTAERDQQLAGFRMRHGADLRGYEFSGGGTRSHFLTYLSEAGHTLQYLGHRSLIEALQ